MAKPFLLFRINAIYKGWKRIAIFSQRASGLQGLLLHGILYSAKPCRPKGRLKAGNCLPVYCILIPVTDSTRHINMNILYRNL